MVAFLRRQRLNLPVAPMVAGALSILVALVFALMPTRILENLVIESGIASVLSAAEPPLGFTARAGLIFACGGGVGLVTWFGLYLMLGSRSIWVNVRGDGDAPVLRRADAHPDAPPRRPLFANSDLGTPFLEVNAKRPVRAPVEEREEEPAPIEPAPIEDAIFEPVIEMVPPKSQPRPLPEDWDQPLSAFDPGSIPSEPLPWSRPTQPSPRPQMFEPEERFETFELTPMVRMSPPPPPGPEPEPWPEPVQYDPIPEPISEPMPEPIRARAPDRDASASIHALLDRLERGVSRKEFAAVPPPPPAPMPIRREESLEDTLDSLRRLATRAG